MAYLESTDGIQYVIIRHVASGAEVRRIELPDAAWSPLTLDLSANHLVVNRRSNDGVVSAWLYDLNQVNPEPLALAVDGEAYLTLAPVTVQGPIPGP